MSPIDDRLAGLEAKVGDLTESIRGLRERVSVLEGAGRSAAEEPEVEPDLWRPPLMDRGSPDLALPLLGRASLILGGAFLLRMLTESGTLPPRLGVLLGLAYAGLWLGVADLGARRGRRLGPVVLTTTGLLIACPLLVEAAAKFRILDVSTALAVLALFAAVTFAIAEARSLPALAWAATLFPVATAFALVATARALLPATVFLIALGVATDRLAESRIGSTVRWPAAAAADLAVLVLIFVAARPGGPVGPYRGLSLVAALLPILLLPAGYVASFTARILVAGRAPGIFEWPQTLLALLLGGLGARLVRPPGFAAALLATAGLAAFGAYLAAIRETRDAPPRRFAYFSSTALLILLLFLTGGPSRPLAAAVWCGVALATAAAAARWRRPVLAIHSIVGILVAAFLSGLAAWLGTISAAGDLTPVRPLPLALVAGLCGAGTYALLAGREPLNRSLQIGAAFGASLAALTLFGGLVLLVAAASHIQSRPVPLAALRSGVLTLLTIALAVAAARLRRQEIAWIAWALLFVGALKILLHDVLSGRAAVLALSFAIYGVALIVAPRFLKAAAGERHGAPGGSEPAAATRRP